MERKSDTQEYQQLQTALEDARAKRAAASLMLQQVALTPDAFSEEITDCYRSDFRDASEEQECLQAELDALLASSPEVQALLERDAIALLRLLLRAHGTDTHVTHVSVTADDSEAFALSLLAKLDSEEGKR